MQIHELPSGTPTDADLLPFDTGAVNYKTPFSGFDLKENTATFTSADEADPAQFKTVDPIETGPIKTILNRLSMAISNVRYIWKVLSAIVSKTAIINYNESTGTFSIYHDENHQVVLNKSVNGSYDLFAVRQNNSVINLNDTLGTVNIQLHSNLGAKHRLFICDGSNPDYAHAQMVLRCEDSYIERPRDMNRLNFVAGDGAYITIGGDGASSNVGRMYFYCNSLVMNGYIAYTGTFKDQTGKTVTVRNGIITSVA